MYTNLFSNNLKSLCVLLLFFTITNSFGAPRLQIQRSNIEKMSDLWNLQIVSDFNSSKIVSLKITAYNSSNMLLYEASSDNFVLQTGISNFSSNQQQLVHIKYSNEDLLKMVTNGELTVVVSMLSPGSFTELSQIRQTVKLNTVQNQESLDTTSPGKIKKYVDIGGTVELTGLYNTREDTLFYMPFDYFRLRTSHQVKISDLPFTYDMYVTTEQKYTNQRLNSYSFRFDYETFKQQLLTKITQKVEAIEQLGDVNQLLDKKDQLTKSAILDSLKDNKLVKEEYIEKYKEYIAIDSLKNYLGIYDEAGLKKAIAELDKYRKADSIRNLTKAISVTNITQYISDTITNTLDTAMSDYRSVAHSAQNQYDELTGKSVNVYLPDSLRNRADSTISAYDSIYHSVQNKYDKLLSKYNNNRDSLNHFLGKLNNYTLQDLLSFSRLNSIVNDKISGYEKYYNKKEIEKLKQLKSADVNDLEGQLSSIGNKYGILERKEQLLNSLKRFEVGTVYPYYSNYTVNGVALNGYNINYTYRNIYTSFSGGKQLNIVNDSINNFIELKKPVLFAFAFGYGEKLGNHIHLNYSYGSRSFKGQFSEQSFTAKNHVIAPDFSYRLLKGKWIVSGEIPVSFTDKNITDGKGDQKIGFASELALNGILSKTTDIEIRNTYINEDFYSFGVPFFYSNYLTSRYKIKQRISQSITADVGYVYEKFFQNTDNNRVPTDIHTVQGAVNIGHKKWNINMTYAPVWLQIKDRMATKHLIHTSGLGISSNYPLKKNKQLISTMGFDYNMFYNAQTFISDYGSVLIENNVIQINKSFNFYIIERIVISNDYNISVNFSLQKNKFIDEFIRNFIICGISYSQNIHNKINYTLTYQAMNNMKNSLRHNAQCQLNYNISRHIGIGTTLNYDYLNGTVEGRNYNKTNAFQIMTNVVFKI